MAVQPLGRRGVDAHAEDKANPMALSLADVPYEIVRPFRAGGIPPVGPTPSLRQRRCQRFVPSHGQAEGDLYTFSVFNDEEVVFATDDPGCRGLAKTIGAWHRFVPDGVCSYRVEAQGYRLSADGASQHGDCGPLRTGLLAMLASMCCTPRQPLRQGTVAFGHLSVNVSALCSVVFLCVSTSNARESRCWGTTDSGCLSVV